MKLMVTFGREHMTLGGERLHNCFLVVEGDDDEDCRKKIFEIRGDQWAFCYTIENLSMTYLIRKWNLYEVSAQQAQIHGAEK